MPRHGANICPKCKRWGTTPFADGGKMFVRCNHRECGYQWRTRSRYVHRQLLREGKIT